MHIAFGLFFLLLPLVFHLIVTGTLISGLWVYFLGALLAGAFILTESAQSDK